MPLRILISDSKPESSDLLRRLFSGCGFESRVASDSSEFLEYVRTFSPDVLLVAEATSKLEKQALATLLERCQQGKSSVIFMTCSPSHESHLPEFAGPLVRRLADPWTSKELLSAIFETTYIGGCDARISHLVETATAPKRETIATQ